MKPDKTNQSSAGKRRIFLVDDHPVTREGLARLINGEPDLEVCGEAATAASALAGVDRLRPDLAIIDLTLAKGSDGLELIKDLSARNLRLPMLAVSMRDENLYAERALRAGAMGYVMKEEPAGHIKEAIRAVLKREVYLSKAMRGRLLNRLTRTADAPLASEIEQLSDRELEVYRLLGQGLGTSKIAGELHLSVSTVQTYRTHIKEKLHFTTAPEMVRHAVEWVHSQTT